MRHLSPELIERLRARALATDELGDAVRHLSECEECAALLRPQSEIESAVSRLRLMIDEGKLMHLSYTEIERLTDGKIVGAAREIAAGHLALCATCRAEFADFNEFFNPAPSPAPPDPLPPPPNLPGFDLSEAPLPPGPPAAPPPIRPVLKPPPAAVPASEVARRRRAFRHRVNRWISVATIVAAAVAAGLAAFWIYLLSPPGPLPSEKPRVSVRDAGGEIGIDAKGKLYGLNITNPALAEGVFAALANQRLDPPRWLRGTGAQVPGGVFSLIGPLGGAIDTDVPVFNWTALGGARSYEVLVFDEAFREVVRSGPLTGVEWKPADPLKRGVNYSWRVAAKTEKITVSAPTIGAPAVKFRVLSRPDKAELDVYRREMSASNLAMAVIYLGYGMVDEAEAAARALLAANPSPDSVATPIYRSIDPKVRGNF